MLFYKNLEDFMKNLEHLFKIFDHLIESLEDAHIEPAVIEMVSEARAAFEEYTEEEDSYTDD